MDGRNAGRPLYLALDNAGRSALAASLNLSADDVEEAICRVVGRTFWPQGDPYWRHAKELKDWQKAGRKAPPPFTALLFTLSHAAERMESDGEFSHTNYYLRLAEVTGADRARLSFHGRSTLQFWRAFSSWLAATNYAHGRPTARQIGSQKYVSLAISQAIVRAEDRQCFHHLFQKYGFTPTDDVSLDEMGQYIASWIHGPGANKRLKAAFNRPELRPRIAEVALAELGEWGGEDLDLQGRPTSSARLSLAAAVLPGFPRRKLSLAIGRKWQGEDPVELLVEGGTSTTLDNALYGGFATLAASDAVQMPRVMSEGLSLAAADGSHRHDWRPRLVIPFVRSQSGPFWNEVSRASTGTDHIVLVRDHSPIRREVDALLAEIALPGYTCAEAPSMAGLPSGWLLYEGVSLLRAPAETPEKVADLAPLPVSGGIRIEQGMSIGDRIWHRRSPPVVRFDALAAGARISIHEGIDEDGELLASAVAANGSAVVDLSKVALPASGNIFVLGTDGKSEQAESLLVRSARRPRPLDRRGAGLLGWQALDTAGDQPWEDGESSTVVGLLVRGHVEPLVASSLTVHGELGEEGELEPLGLDVDEAIQPVARRVLVQSAEVAATMSCSERAHHWYEVEFVPPGTPKAAPVALQCRDCGHAYLRQGGATKKGGAQATTRAVERPPAPAAPIPVARIRQTRIDLDLLLDALSFMGAGNWASFEALVADKVEQPWEAMSVAEDLALLGHLDLRRSVGDGRIKSWCVSPPALGLSTAGHWILAGFRNEPLVEGLRSRVEAAGGQVALEEHAGQPALVRVDGLDGDGLAAAVLGLADPHGRPLQLVADAPARLASACLSMAGRLALLEPATLGRIAGADIYDLTSHRWRPSTVDGPGAYRTRNGATAYFFKAQGGQAWRAPHATAKLLSAREHGARLHAYDEQAGAFEAVLGCDLPTLVGRALVACSGVLPVMVGGRIRFGAVRPDIASAALDILYPREPKALGLGAIN